MNETQMGVMFQKKKTTIKDSVKGCDELVTAMDTTSGHEPYFPTPVEEIVSTKHTMLG